MSRTYALVDLDAIQFNIRQLKGRLPQKTQLCAVVKADAYGHGYVPCAKAAVAAGADWLAVATPEEGKTLREAGVRARILVLGGVDESAAELSVTYGLDQCVFTKSGIQVLSRLAGKIGKQAAIHIKVDTGMGRIGVRTIEELDELLDEIQKDSGLVLAGMFSHFSTSDESDKSFSGIQESTFRRFAQHVKARGFAPILHIANSAACMELPQASFDMVRPGIAIYGLYPSGEVKREIPLRPAMQVISQVAYVKEVPAGQPISYGRTFYAPRSMRIATIGIGYGDGFKRALSNRGSVLIRGQRAPIVGRVCMDQTMVDVTDIPGVSAGDQVVILGRQGGEEITADEIAELCDTINYEIVLSFLPRVARVYIGGKE